MSQAYDEGVAVESSGGVENVESGAGNIIERPFLPNSNPQGSKTSARRRVFTGDDSQVWLYASICAVSAGLLVVLAFLRKKYQKE
ncbi:hypothetical protein [Clostridium vitabionis]|uniref:hypothetical protein n=1 Tax=Clostridium vitabionis TaxID=2784388 RepID=UPI00188C3D12|nr:hypothetical protein [Clostridium vitabionis]